jgi:hypothetical protein
LLLAALTIVATGAFFIEYLPPFKRVHLFSDIEVFHYPLQRYAFRSLKEGRFPQWDPGIYCGLTFAGNIAAALFYPPSWVMYATNWRHAFLPFKGLEYFAIAHIWLAFGLCYLWLRGRQLDWVASVLGASAFACGGYMLWQIVHLGVAPALAWMPLGLWGVDEAVERGDWRPLWKTALASALCFLAGYPPSWLAFCCTVFLYGLTSRGHWRAALGVCAAVAASMLLAMVQWLPTLEARSFMYGEERYEGELRSVILPLFVADWQDLNRDSSQHYLGVMYLYWGLPVTFALAWALYRKRLRPYAQAAAVLAACLILVIDPGGLIYHTILRIPALANTAQSYNFCEGMAAMAALIAGIGVADFLDRGAKQAAASWRMPVILAAMMAWAARQLWVWAHGGGFASGGRAVAETGVALALFAAGAWSVRQERGARRVVMASGLILIALVDYKAFGTNRLFNTRDGDVDELHFAQGIRGITSEAYEALWTNRQYRVASDQTGGPKPVDYRLWGLASPQGLDPFLPQQYREVIERWTRFRTNREFDVDFANDAMMQGLGVRYAITHAGATSSAFLAASPVYRLVGPDTAFYRVYEYREARPPYGWENGAGDAQATGWLPERRSFRVHSESGGRFTLVEQYYPGWTATIDGRQAAIERWKGAFQSIAVPAGDHTVVFAYHCRLLPAGTAISLAAIAALVWVAWSARVKAQMR